MPLRAGHLRKPSPHPLANLRVTGLLKQASESLHPHRICSNDLQSPRQHPFNWIDLASALALAFSVLAA